jgi:putative queuosine salvage protein
MGLCDEVRAHASEVAARARFVEIDVDRLGDVEPGPPPALDPRTHYLDGPAEDVAAYLLALDTINFGSGWFPTLRKRRIEGREVSGYFTIASALADRFRSAGPWSAAQLRDLGPDEVAEALGQDPAHELMALYARALADLGAWLGERSARQALAAADGSAERLAEQLAAGMPFFADRGFYKRAQIAACDLHLAGVVQFADVDRLTIFADNLVPHVLRVDEVLRYEPGLAARIDAGELLEAGSPEEVEIRACAIHACELVAARLEIPPRVLDSWLWNRGQAPPYKSRPRHRACSVYY